MDQKVYFTSALDEALTEELTNILPRWRTHLCDINVTEKKITELEIRFYIAATTREEIKTWLSEYESITKTSHSIRSTDKAFGKYILFKQRLVCHHNTVSSFIFDFSPKSNSRNTNCPSRMTVTLHSVKKRYQGKNKAKGAILAEMPCEVDLQIIHNHSTHSIEALKVRKPTHEVKEKLLQLFRQGHSPLTALQCLRIDIQMNCDDYLVALLDRGQCPDYQYCYHLYGSELKKKFEPCVFDMMGKKFLQYRLEQYNCQEGEMCAQALFCNSNYVIGICTPLMKRVHKYIGAASEMVFLNTTQIQKSSTLFVLTTYSECGELPLAVFITSTPTASLIKMGFKLIKEIVGDSSFGKCLDGPQAFVIDDCVEQHSAIEGTWPASNILLCFFHVLQSVWKWLTKTENMIPLEKQCTFFNDFKAIMFAETVEDCCLMYEIARNKSVLEFSMYCAYLEGMWERRKQWARAYRNNLIVQGNYTTTYAEAIVRIQKDNILDHMKDFDVIQVVDFMLTRFVSYYKKRLLHAAHYGQRRNPLTRIAEVPLDKILQNVTIYNENILLVPRGNASNIYNVVNLDVLLCSCLEGKNVRTCQHIDWASRLVFPDDNDTYLHNGAEQNLFYTVATNEIPLEEHSVDLPQSSFPHGALHLIVYNSESQNANASISTPDIQMENADVETHNYSGHQIAAEHVLDKITELCKDFVDKSPEEMNKGLEQMFENMQKISSPTIFASCCSNFGEGVEETKCGNND